MALLLFWQSMTAPASTGEWFTEPIVAAAIITSVMTIVGLAVKDYFFKVLEERRSNRREQSAIYERYSHPLVIAADHLQVRLHEILCQKHRSVYLLGKGLSLTPETGNDYRAYKKLSTVYRLAAVLGWIRACRREFSYLRVADPGRAKSVHKAINDFERALADGSWVEKERILRLCKLWHLSDADGINKSPNEEGLATHVDNLIWEKIDRRRLEHSPPLDEIARQELCREIADYISSNLDTDPVGKGLMEHTWESAFEILSIRETWIYRDWQSAIGDMMIQTVESDSRKYEVIGFGDFEELVETKGPKQLRALVRLSQIFDDIDLGVDQRFDARPSQLLAVAKANASLILAIDQIQGRRSIVSEDSKKWARQILQIKEPVRQVF